MYIPNPQSILAAGLALCGGNRGGHNASTITSGKILDYALPTCIDEDGNTRCTRPFTVQASKCYSISWTTDGTVSHTTVEVRDVGSSELVFYRDTDGEWTPEKNELVYMDFKPKVWKTGNDTVEYKVVTCNCVDPNVSTRAPGEKRFRILSGDLVGLIVKRRTFLEEQKWRTALWPANSTPKNEQSRLTDILALIPGFLEDEINLDKEPRGAKSTDFISKLTSGLVELSKSQHRFSDICRKSQMWYF
ncbi:hypothetical protein G7Y89_g11536 [Cudoniella acicularis]|uniref:Uncharacterized protein n=1 Tax=Cudoniella acicularis TaxID=354080 RepID=A0A8H4VY74_9HELO|nr:hypothetical protein G7Y89_g11536 [Cudoniella acicularis]